MRAPYHNSLNNGLATIQLHAITQASAVSLCAHTVENFCEISIKIQIFSCLLSNMPLPETIMNCCELGSIWLTIFPSQIHHMWWRFCFALICILMLWHIYSDMKLLSASCWPCCITLRYVNQNLHYIMGITHLIPQVYALFVEYMFWFISKSVLHIKGLACMW